MLPEILGGSIVWPWIAAIYAAGVVVTAGHLYRNGESELTHRLRQVVAALLWPLYWLIVHGIAGTFGVFVRTSRHIIATAALLLDEIFRQLSLLLAGFANAVARVISEESVFTIYSIGLIFFFAYYLGSNWNDAAGLANLATIGRAVLWSLVWPVYFLT